MTELLKCQCGSTPIESWHAPFKWNGQLAIAYSVGCDAKCPPSTGVIVAWPLTPSAHASAMRISRKAWNELQSDLTGEPK